MLRDEKLKILFVVFKRILGKHTDRRLTFSLDSGVANCCFQSIQDSSGRLSYTRNEAHQPLVLYSSSVLFILLLPIIQAMLLVVYFDVL